MIVLEELTRVYGKFTALDKLSMNIAEGELHGFVGPNGAGKTTTMRILATLLPASGGRATIDGVDVAKNPRRVRTLVGYMPDFFGVYDSLKAWEYLDFYGRLYGLSAARRRERVDQLLELVRLTDKRDSYVDSLSRGMKQRLCLAHSLIHDPRLLILDEPASGMDPRARAEMKDILRALRDMKKTVLISSHILPELSEMCDSLTIIDHGKLVFTGSVEALDRKMNGDAPIDIRFAPGAGEESVDAAVALLKQYPGVSGITQEDARTLRVETSAQLAGTDALLRALIEAGAPVEDFHRAPMNLEKVFVTNTGSFRIALGKLLESLGYLAFLIVAMLPFNCSILAYGSVGLPYLFQSALFLLLTAYAASSVGLFCSALFRKTVSATIAAYIIVLAIGLMTFLGVTLSGASTYYDFDLAALSHEELIALLPKSLFFCPPLGLLALLANQSGALQSVLQQLVGYGNSQALALVGYDLLANAVMAFMACAATVLTLLSTAFVRPRLHARRRRK